MSAAGHMPAAARRAANGGRTNVVEASSLGKRYGRAWALRECTLATRRARGRAVGPNGAGKTTLLNLAVGLAAPSAGGVTVLAGLPGPRPRWTASRSSPRTRRCIRTCPPRTCCT
jgi:ABC-type branched-subunit amino acid transport system ATPase component